MSLINKVLRDLDARSVTRGSGPVPYVSVHHGLRPTAPMSRRRSRLLLPFILLVAAGTYAGVSTFVIPLPYWEKLQVATGLESTPAPLATLSSDAEPNSGTPAEVAIDLPTTANADAEQQIQAEAVVATIGLASSENNTPENTGVVTAERKPKPAPEVAPAKVVTRKATTSNKAKPKKVRSVRKKIATVAKAPSTQTREQEGALKKRIKPVSKAELAENAFREGVIAMEQGNRAHAQTRFRETLKLKPQHTQASELLAAILIASGKNNEGQKVLEQALKRTPGHAQLSNLLARLYVDHKNDSRALALLESAQDKNPVDAGLMSFRAALYQRVNRHEEAAKSYQQALTIKPNEGRWWIGLGISLEVRQDLRGAQSAYEKALQTPLSNQLAQYAQQRLGAVKRP